MNLPALKIGALFVRKALDTGQRETRIIRPIPGKAGDISPIASLSGSSKYLPSWDY